jgi:DNA-binding MarR family transcriptional regulator
MVNFNLIRIDFGINMKKDHRWGKGPSERKQRSLNLIREALKEGRKTFTDLLEATGLSRPALAYNLKEMYRNGEVEKEVDPKDYRVKYYSLTPYGRNEIHKQEEIVFLHRARALDVETDKFLTINPEIAATISETIHETLKHIHTKAVACTIKRIKEEVPDNCIFFSIYSLAKKQGVKKIARRLAEIAKSAMLAEIRTLDKRELSKMPDVAIVFRFNKSIIEKHLRAVHAICQKITID